MIYQCKNCATALRFNPQKGLLECDACGSAYQLTEYEEPDTADGKIRLELYSCTACGAKLAVNGTECSSFCSYCGQPTVIYDRVSDVKRPDCIIPFRVSKEEAVDLIRKQLSKGPFIADDIKNFEAEQVRGIYIPFQLYDVNYTDSQFWCGKIDSFDTYHMRKAKVLFHDLTLDASKQLNDDLTRHLEPYDTSKLVPFHSAYLSGFYANCFDYTAKELENEVKYRCRNLVNNKILKTLPNPEEQHLRETYPYHTILDSKYAMLPVWFMTFRHKEVPYTFVVNGQTKKVVGAVPYSKKKAYSYLGILTAILSSLAFLLLHILFSLLRIETVFDIIVREWVNWFVVLVACFIGIWEAGNMKIKKINKHINRTKESTLQHFAKNRQEE
ncbi:MAG: hypothetical protein IKT67_10530 [Lachnospiraceae bacterium]|nr:hypothetical protein [Lachnospiraceae bacterium]